MTLRVVQFSGGVTSWAAAMRVAEQHGTKDLVLLFADVLTEDPDVYRFLADSSRQLGVPLTRVCDGRTPWQVFHDVRYIGNSRFAPCTYHLKIKPCRAWLSEHADPDDTILYVGLDASPRDRARAPGIIAGWRPWTVQFPMMEAPPVLAKPEQLAWCRTVGVEPAAMYARRLRPRDAAVRALGLGNTNGLTCCEWPLNGTHMPSTRSNFFVINSETSQSFANDAAAPVGLYP